MCIFPSFFIGHASLKRLFVYFKVYINIICFRCLHVVFQAIKLISGVLFIVLSFENVTPILTRRKYSLQTVPWCVTVRRRGDTSVGGYQPTDKETVLHATVFSAVR